MRRLSDERGLAGKILVGVVAWALGAVLMLTSTLVSAQRIDDRVGVITAEVSPIDKDLDSVNLAVQTNAIAQQIQTAAKPLSGQLDQVLATKIVENAESIDGNVKSINATVNSIGAHAKAINGNVLSINGTVRAINGSAKNINASVRSIDGNVAAIGQTVNGISGNLAGVLDAATSIRGEHGDVQGFGTGVAAINRRAEAVVALVNAIKTDTANILTFVVSIERSAKSIDSKAPKLLLF